MTTDHWLVRTAKDAPAPAQPAPKLLAEPATDQLRAHLLGRHRMPTAALDGATPTELATWHRAEHKHDTLGWLGHTHDKTGVPLATEEDRLHAGYLKAVKAGKAPQHLLDEWRDRAAMASRRRAEGRPLSPYDRRCIELDQAAAERAAKKARRPTTTRRRSAA